MVPAVCLAVDNLSVSAINLSSHWIEKRLDTAFVQQSCPGNDEFRIWCPIEHKAGEIVLVDTHNSDLMPLDSTIHF